MSELQPISNAPLVRAAAADAVIVATFKPCEQNKFRIELPARLGRQTRAAIRRQALREVNDTFLDCTRRYQELGWVDGGNFAFTDSRHSPSDSKSEFLHSLHCLKMIELSYRHLRAEYPEDELPEFLVALESRLPMRLRKGLEKLCAALNLQRLKEESVTWHLFPKMRIGGDYRAPRDTANPFSNQPVSGLDAFRKGVYNRLGAVPTLRRGVNLALNAVIAVCAIPAVASRAVFNFYYRAAAARVLQLNTGARNVFTYFDHRSGRSEDVPGYLRWKFGTDFAEEDLSVIPFSHIGRPGHAYSFSAMIWAYRALKRMESCPRDGCILVNYLISVPQLLELRVLRTDERRRIRRGLGSLVRETDDFIETYIYKEFIATLNQGNAFAMEVSESYRRFFEMVRPGVVLQADALSKTARHFTARARRAGCRVVYVADRICTPLRTSNQLIRDGGDNPHLPDRLVVFDEVTRDEFLRQHVPADRIHSYWRNFGAAGAPAEVGKGDHVLIYLQAYGDHIGGMIRLGEEIAGKFPELRVVYQEHPDFRVADPVKRSIAATHDGRVRFLAPGETVEFPRLLALITGYSTAAVPGVMGGLPLIWLRRQIDNSVYGEPYLERIGFPADKTEEVFTLLKRLRRQDPATLAAVAAATAQAKEIFTPPSSGEGRTLPQAVIEAVDRCFAEIPQTNPPA